MQNTIVKAFEDNSEVVPVIIDNGDIFETREWLEIFWNNIYLRGAVIFDNTGFIDAAYKFPDYNFHYGWGYIIDKDGIVHKPYCGFNPATVIDAINNLIYDFLCGDADGNDTVNLLDITFLISYLYAGGDPPETLDACDVNDSGGINILDITYLISYLYKDGPEPVCY